MKVDWHCPNCEYLHIDDNGNNTFSGDVVVKCIVCKADIVLTYQDRNTKWRER